MSLCSEADSARRMQAGQSSLWTASSSLATTCRAPPLMPNRNSKLPQTETGTLQPSSPDTGAFACKGSGRGKGRGDMGQKGALEWDALRTHGQERLVFRGIGSFQQQGNTISPFATVAQEPFDQLVSGTGNSVTMANGAGLQVPQAPRPPTTTTCKQQFLAP